MIEAANSKTNNFHINRMYFEYGMLINPIAIIMIPLVGKRILQRPSLKQNASTRLCLSIASISTNGSKIGMSRNAFAVPLPMKNSKKQITKNIAIKDSYGPKPSIKLYT